MNTIQELISAINKLKKEEGIDKDRPNRVEGQPINAKNQVEEGTSLNVESFNVFNPFTCKIEEIKEVVIKSK